MWLNNFWQAKEEPSSFTVKLVKYADVSKIKLIKEVKSLIEGMNLVQVRLIISIPCWISENIRFAYIVAIGKEIRWKCASGYPKRYKQGGCIETEKFLGSCGRCNWTRIITLTIKLLLVFCQLQLLLIEGLKNQSGPPMNTEVAFFGSFGWY